MAKDVLLIPHTVPSMIRRERYAGLETKALMLLSEAVLIGGPTLVAISGAMERGSIAEGLAVGGFAYGVIVVGVTSAVQR